MRMMLKVHMDTEAGNAAIERGTLSQVMEQTLARLNPEAAYFGPENGKRTAWMVFDMKDPSELPVIAEPLFSQLNARIELHPVMTGEDLQRGLQQLDGGSA